MRRVWLFQANPKRYLLTNELRYARVDDWKVVRHRNFLKKNDRVILWQSGFGRGIYGTGQFVSGANQAGKECRADISYDEPFLLPLLEPTLRQNAVLRHLSVLDAPHQSNPYPVTETQWNELLSLQKSCSASAFSLESAREAVQLEGGFFTRGLDDARKRVMKSIAVRQGQATFRSGVINGYLGQCAITQCKTLEALDAAHIYPYCGPKTNDLRNGILLRADVHTLFDLGLIVIHPISHKVVVAPALQTSEYGQFAGKTIHLPKSPGCRPSREALRSAYQRYLALAASN